METQPCPNRPCERENGEKPNPKNEIFEVANFCEYINIFPTEVKIYKE